ncbi:hypothetical protein AGMMS49521_3270 [Campylobacterota bacterium]|nr:hypothetical protein AGMMS49521_3270 [Campylobacterota bacterium]
MNQPINQSTNQPINQSTNQPINQSTNQPINLKPLLGLDNLFIEGKRSFEQICETHFLTDLFHWLSQILGDSFTNYEFFVFSPTPEERREDILTSSMYYESDRKKVLIVISDESGKTPYHLSPYYYAIFKSYLKLDKFYVNNIFNFPLGCVKDVPKLPIIPINKRKYNIFFSGNLNQGRAELYLLCWLGNYPKYILKRFRSLVKKALFRTMLLFVKSRFDDRFSDSYIRFTNGFQQGMSSSEYGQFLSDSKIVLCPKGFISPECFRHYEAMRAGCVIISEKLPKTYFYRGSPIIEVDHWREGLKVAAALQQDPNELERISKLTQDWYEKIMSEKGTAQYMKICLSKL